MKYLLILIILLLLCYICWYDIILLFSCLIVISFLGFIWQFKKLGKIKEK